MLQVMQRLSKQVAPVTSQKAANSALPCAGVYKQGSASELSAQQLGTCIENTAKRRAALLQLLQQTLSGN